MITYNPTAKLSVAAEADYDHQGFKSTEAGIPGADYAGFAGFAKYQFNPKYYIAGRYEYLNDHDGLATLTAFPQHIQSFTITGQRKLAGHLLASLEYRHDQSYQNFFQRNVVSGGTTGTAIRGNALNFDSGDVQGENLVKVGLTFVLEPNN